MAMLTSLIALCTLAHLSCALELPPYVLDYAPLLYLHSEESHFPSDIAEHLRHVVPRRNGLSVDVEHTLETLDDASLSHPDTYLTSLDDPAESPQASWLTSAYGKPDNKGRSAAPAFCVLVQKHGLRDQLPDGDLDAFYFAFFSFSRGLPVDVLGGKELGNHVGDWEHSMVRFRDGKPQAVFTARHGGGDAFAYEAVKKRRGRPVLYISKGALADLCM